MSAAWLAEEKARIAASPAPAWYDEGLGPEFAADAASPSLVFDDVYAGMLDEFFLGVDPNGMCTPTDEGMRVAPEIRGGDAHSGMTLLHFAASCADVPYMKALLRAGATLDFGYDKELGTPLHVICKQFLAEGDALGARSRIAAIRFLLDVGADPGKSCAVEPLLKLVLRDRDATRGLELAALLFAAPRGAALLAEAPAYASFARGGKTRKAFLTAAKRAKGAPRNVLACACGSGRPFDACHGAANGVPLHARQPCPCADNKRRARDGAARAYGACCFAREVYLRETLCAIIPPPSDPLQRAIESLALAADDAPPPAMPLADAPAAALPPSPPLAA